MGHVATRLLISNRWSGGSRDSSPKRQPEDPPSTKGEPFHRSKASRHRRHHLYHYDRDAHDSAERGHRGPGPYATTARERDEGKAGSTPADRPNRGTHVADGYEGCVAEECRRAGENRHERDRQCWSSEPRIQGAEPGRDQSAPSERVEQSRGRDEVSIEHLEQRQAGARENE